MIFIISCIIHSNESTSMLSIPCFIGYISLFILFEQHNQNYRLPTLLAHHKGDLLNDKAYQATSFLITFWLLVFPYWFLE